MIHDLGFFPPSLKMKFSAVPIPVEDYFAIYSFVGTPDYLTASLP